MNVKRIVLVALILPLVTFGQKQLSLQKCRQLAIKQNKNLQAAVESHAAQADLNKAALKDFLPSLSLDGNYTRFGDSWQYETSEMSLPIYEFNSATGEYEIQFVQTPDGKPLVNPETGNPVPQNILKIPAQNLEIGQRENYIMNLRLTQPIFTGGKIYQKYKISKYTEDMAAARLRLKKSEVKYRTDYYYWNICAIREQVKLAQKYATNINSHLQDLQNYLAEGLVTRNDVLKVQVKKNEAETKVMKAQNALKLAKMALCQHLGLPFQTKIQLTDTLRVETNSWQYQPNLADQALHNRPEITLLEQKFNINSAMVDLAWSRYAPNIYLTANYFGVKPNPYHSLQNEFGRDWSVGVMCEFKLFNWNKRGNQLTAARHKRASTRYELAASRDKIKLEIQKVINKLNEALEVVEMNQTSLKQAEQNLKIAHNNFQEGIIKSSDFLDAQTLWRKSYADFIESKKAYKIARAKYKKVLAKQNEIEGAQE